MTQARELLDERLKAAGMLTIDQMMQPMNRFQVNAGMTDLAFYEQWLERKCEEYTRMMARRELGDKDVDDELYEWVLAHRATFHEALINFRAAALSMGKLEWRGIDQAPIDTPVLVFCPDYPKHKWTGKVQWGCKVLVNGDERWCSWNMGPMRSQPTMFQPLPSPPLNLPPIKEG